ncbi:MAG: matrixin family metalloprotease, partial [Lacunisphaera sp.]|nr:matrixin family metalloprotease [Lacunisphaera sp.]
MKNNPLRILAGGLTALVLATAASGYTYILNKNTGLPVRWTDGTATLRIMLGSAQTNIDGTTFNTSAKGAADTWNALLGAIAFQSTFTTGTPTDGRPSGGSRTNDLAFASTIYGTEFGEKTLAVTTSWFSGNTRVEGDIIFNSARTWDSYPGATRANLYDLHRVTLHELGHFLGLDHPDEAEPPQGVSAVMNSRISSLDTLTMDDITGAQNLYGPPGPPENDAFAKATVIGPLDANNKAVLPGFNTLATKETSEPNHAGNSGGHSVWWKWTAPASGPVTLDCRGSYYDTTLGVYTGTALGSLTVVAANDDINPGVVQASSVTFTASTGTVYYFAVDGFDADTGGITLNLSLSPVGGTKPTITTQPFT